MTPPPEAGLNLASVMRLLWRARRLVAVGATVGLLVATTLIYEVSLGAPPSFERRGHSIGVASSQVLVDSKSSQSVDIGEEPVLIDIPGLIARARLLANLIATSPLREQIAQRAGIDRRTFLATAPSVGFDSPKPTPNASAQPNVMSVSFNEALPIVTINAEAADEATAARISSGAATELAAYLGSLTARDRVKDAQQLVVKPLGAADSATVRRGPRRLAALAAFGFVLVLWCTVIVIVTRMRLLRDSVPAPGAAAGTVSDTFPGLTAVPPSAGGRASHSQPPPPAALWERPERPERPRRGVSA